MIKILAKSTIKPGCLEGYLETVKGLVEGSQAEEGNLYYTLNQDINDENSIVIMEGWKDQEAIDIHNASEHFTTIVPKLAQYLLAPSEVTLYKELM